MLGFEDALCPRYELWQAVDDNTYWMSGIYCRGNETDLDQCFFEGWGIHGCYLYLNRPVNIVCLEGKY